jgi:hypothetical protein
MNTKKNIEICSAISLFIGLSLFASSCRAKPNIEKTVWFQRASQYDQARTRMLKNIGTSEEKFVNDFFETDKRKQQYLQAKQPTEEEIVSVLRSPNIRVQRVGLAAMSLRPIETAQVRNILFEFITHPDRDFRLYVVFSLEEFKSPSLQSTELEQQLLELLKAEGDAEVLFQGIPLLGKFHIEEAVPYLTDQLMKEGDENVIFRFAAFVALKEMGEPYYAKAADYINRYGSSEVRKDLSDREHWWKKMKPPKNKEE